MGEEQRPQTPPPATPQTATAAAANDDDDNISPSRPVSPNSPAPPASPAAPGSAQDDADPSRSRGSSSASGGRLRGMSLRFKESAPPIGFLHAAGGIVAKAPTVGDIRKGSFSTEGWSSEGQRRNSTVSTSDGARLSRTGTAASARTGTPDRPNFATRSSTARVASPGNDLIETADEHRLSQNVTGATGATADTLDKDAAAPVAVNEASSIEKGPIPLSSERSSDSPLPSDPANRVYPNGYQFPAKRPWGEATIIALKAFWRFFLTPLGFLVTIYGLNVVAWGGMLFLLLVQAAPAMCHPSCGDINSARRVWIENDSQIVNALFCVTGFGLIPWRFRDLYYLLQWRIQKKESGLRRLAGINRSWFRLEGCDKNIPAGNSFLGADKDKDKDLVESEEDLNNPSLPLPPSSRPDEPLTGEWAPPTKPWKLDFYIWMYVANTALQAVLSGFMWGLNRYNRPSWSTGLFVALACLVAAAGGLMVFYESKDVKKIEGIPVPVDQTLKDVEKDMVTKKLEKQEKGKKGGFSLFGGRKTEQVPT